MTLAAACAAFDTAIADLATALATPPATDIEAQQFAWTLRNVTDDDHLGFASPRMDGIRYFYQDEPGSIGDGIENALAVLAHATIDVFAAGTRDQVRQMGAAGRAALYKAIPLEWAVYVQVNASNADLQPNLKDASLPFVLPSAVTDTDAGDNEIADNASEDDTVGLTVHASDAYSNAFTYSLTDDADGRFEVDAATGVVTIVDVTGLVIDDEYVVTARATRTVDGRYTEANFTLTVVSGVVPMYVWMLQNSSGIDTGVTWQSATHDAETVYHAAANTQAVCTQINAEDGRGFGMTAGNGVNSTYTGANPNSIINNVNGGPQASGWPVPITGDAGYFLNPGLYVLRMDNGANPNLRTFYCVSHP